MRYNLRDPDLSPRSLTFRDAIFLGDRITTAPASLARIVLGPAVTLRQESMARIVDQSGVTTVRVDAGRTSIGAPSSRLEMTSEDAATLDSSFRFRPSAAPPPQRLPPKPLPRIHP